MFKESDAAVLSVKSRWSFPLQLVGEGGAKRRVRLAFCIAFATAAFLATPAAAQNVNSGYLVAAPTGSTPSFMMTGTDANVGLVLTPKGTGTVGIGTTSPNANAALDLGNNTNSLLLPVGTTGQEPTGTPGMLRYNTTKAALEFFNGSWTLVATTTGGSNPSAFSFTNQTGVSTGVTITSNTVTLNGFTGVASAICGTGCINISRNGSWGGTTVNGFQSGDTIAIQQTSSSTQGITTNATVNVGGITSGTWTVTTTSTTPSAFSFTDQSNVTSAQTVSSNAVTLSGFTGTLTATCNGGCTAIGINGVWGGTTYTGIASGNTIAIRTLSASATGTAVTGAVTVGATTSGTWTVTTVTVCQAGITIGQTCPDGTVYAGMSPDTNVPMYTTPCDAGYYYSGGTCVACASGVWSGSGTTCSTTWSSTKYPTWNNGSSNWTVTGYTSQTTGKANTAGLIALSDAGSPYKAAEYCGTLPAFGHSDWYLPALTELGILWTNRTAIGNFDVTDGGTAVSGAYPGLYWSSSENGNYDSYGQRFSDGSQGGNYKDLLFSVRCVRR
jgi:hypothetical protein